MKWQHSPEGCHKFLPETAVSYLFIGKFAAYNVALVLKQVNIRKISRKIFGRKFHLVEIIKLFKHLHK